jgi:hypothetical protein
MQSLRLPRHRLPRPLRLLPLRRVLRPAARLDAKRLSVMTLPLERRSAARGWLTLDWQYCEPSPALLLAQGYGSLRQRSLTRCLRRVLWRARVALFGTRTTPR